MNPLVTTTSLGAVPIGAPMIGFNVAVTTGVATTVTKFEEGATITPGNRSCSVAGSLVRDALCNENRSNVPKPDGLLGLAGNTVWDSKLVIMTVNVAPGSGDSKLTLLFLSKYLNPATSSRVNPVKKSPYPMLNDWNEATGEKLSANGSTVKGTARANVSGGPWQISEIR